MSPSIVNTQLVVQLQPGDDAQVLAAKIDQLVTEHRSQRRDKTQQPTSGWTQESFDQFLRLLYADGKGEYLDIFAEAARRGGAIPRERLMRLLGRDSDRYLNGFTRPITRAMRQLQHSGVLGDPAVAPMQPQYEDGTAAWFTMPDRLVPFVLNSSVLPYKRGKAA